MIVNKSLYPISQNLRSISQMNKQFEALQLQLATGKRYNTLAEMGGDRVHELSLRARLGRIEGFQANILTVENRLSFYTNGLERLDQIEADARALAVPGAYGTDGINFANSRNQATNLLMEVIDILNTDITGQYIFGGNRSDAKPVASFDEMMNGPAGFRQFTLDRYALDGVGDADNPGGMGFGVAGETVTLTGSFADAAGIKIAGVTVNSAGISRGDVAADPAAVPQPTGAGHALSFDSQPAVGDTITISYTLPHSDTPIHKSFTVVAEGTDPMPADSFALGGTAEDTAAAFEASVKAEFVTIGATDLKSASVYKAADLFFNANGEAQAAGAMEWYRGQSSPNPRQTVSANVDENTKAQYGVQANEQGFVELIKGLAVFAVSDDMSDLDPTNARRYDALVAIQRDRLSESNNAQAGSIKLITMELGLAASTVNTVKQRHTQYEAQLETMLADISVAPREEVAMMLLELQIQLQASYQATAMASQLSLVNYLR